MAAANSTRSRKPYKGFPLFLHSSRQWAKKVRGRTIYFGADADRALNLWLAEKDEWLAGRDPRRSQHRRDVSSLVLIEAANQFLACVDELRVARGQTKRNFDEKKDALQLLVNVLGKQRWLGDLLPGDFLHVEVAIVKRFGAAGQRKYFVHIKHFFTWLYESGYIQAPMRFGSFLKPPTRTQLLAERNAKGKRFFEAEVLRELLESLTHPLRAMTLIAINAGLGNVDVGTMCAKHLDLEGGWLDYPRGKSGVPRRAKLWTETVEAIQQSKKSRVKPGQGFPPDVVFTTPKGRLWAQPDRGGSCLSNAFRFALKERKLYKPNRSFYVLRSTFRTVADSVRDQPAVELVMGHSPSDVGGIWYRDHLDDEKERLHRVADHVHRWLFPEEGDR